MATRGRLPAPVTSHAKASWLVMNILQIVSGTEVNEAVRHCLMLTGELVRRGHRLTLVCPSNAAIAEQCACESVQVVESDLHRWPTDELRRIAAVVDQRRIDVVHTHMSRAHSFGVLLRWLTGVPCVATAQSRHVELHLMFNDRVIAASDTARRFHRSYNLVRADRIVTIHNFIDYDRWAHLPEDAGPAFRASVGADDSSLLVGAVGEINRRSGQLQLVRAMPRILSAVPGARLVLAGDLGDASYADQLKSAVEALELGDRVILTGARDDVEAIYAGLDLVASASNEESFPPALLEAMAAGLPVVAARTGGARECVLAGETGLLVPPDDVDALAVSIASLVGDGALRRQYGEAGRRRVEEHFSPESQTARIESVYANVVTQARAA
jgi:glycosyltransferase involved in cell wall biosynthesis